MSTFRVQCGVTRAFAIAALRYRRYGGPVTMLPRRFAPLLALPCMALIAPLAACNPQPDPAVHDGASLKAEPTAEAKARSAALATREKTQLAWLEKTLKTAAHAEVYKAALDQSLGRAAHCRSQRCIETGLRRREARLNFADGKATPIPRMPFPSGRFARKEAGYQGPVRIIPLIDGKAMLVVSLTVGGRPACALDGVMTRDENAETWTVTSLQQKMPRLVLTPGDERTFDLSYAFSPRRPGAPDYCAGSAKIDGTYTLEG